MVGAKGVLEFAHWALIVAIISESQYRCPVFLSSSMLFIFLLDCSGLACFEFVVVVMVIACSRFTLSFVGGGETTSYAQRQGWSPRHFLALPRPYLHHLSQQDPLFPAFGTEPVCSLHVYYHCHSFSDTAKPAVCRRPKIVSFNDLSGFCWIQRMSRERIKGRPTRESEAKVKMRP